MDTFNHDSYCGIYCGACDIMMTGKTGRKHKLASLWSESTVTTFQKKMGVHYDKPYSLKCSGCKSNEIFSICEVCQIRKCARDKKIEHCMDCNDYPCDQIVEFQKMKSFLPHLKINQNNMERIAKIGTDKWLSEQERAWKCHECGTSFSWYSTKCVKCGENLSKYAFKFSFLKSLVLKIGIHFLLPKKKESAC